MKQGTTSGCCNNTTEMGGACSSRVKIRRRSRGTRSVYDSGADTTSCIADHGTNHITTQGGGGYDIGLTVRVARPTTDPTTLSSTPSTAVGNAPPDLAAVPALAVVQAVGSLATVMGTDRHSLQHEKGSLWQFEHLCAPQHQFSYAWQPELLGNEVDSGGYWVTRFITNPCCAFLRSPVNGTQSFRYLRNKSA